MLKYLYFIAKDLLRHVGFFLYNWLVFSHIIINVIIFIG